MTTYTLTKKLKTNIKLLLLSLMFSVCDVTYSQVSRLYTAQSGLTTSEIYSIDIDSKGLAWISGVSSLDIFDGTRFYNINNMINRKGIFFNAVRKVVEYKDDQYWLATSNGLYLFDGKRATMEHKFLMEDEDPVLGLPINQMIDYVKPNCKLISTEGNGVFVFDQEKQEVDAEETNRIRSVVPFLFCAKLFIDSNGHLWGYTMLRRLFRIDLKTMKNVNIDMTPEAAGILSISNVNAIIQQKTNKNLVLATETGILIYDQQQKRLRRLHGATPSTMPITALHEDGNGRVLVGTDNHGIWGITPAETLRPFRYTDPKTNLEFAKVRTFATDSEGNLIIGLAQKGVFVVPNNVNQISYYSFSPNSNKINATSVTSMASDDNYYWVGTDGCGIFRMSKAAMDESPVLFNTGLKSLLIQTIAVDREQRVWVGSYGGGVQCLDGNQFVTPEWVQPLSNAYAMVLDYDQQRNLMFVGTNGQGVFVMDLNNHTISNLYTSLTFNGWIYSLHHDKDGILWIGTAQGIFAYDIAKKSGTEIKFPKSDILIPQCLSTVDGFLLVATNQGLLAYNKETARVSILLDKHNVRSIQVSDQDIWAATSKDIIRIDRSTKKPYIYSSFGGHYMGEYHRNAVYMNAEKNIFFGGDNGIVRFNPSRVRMSHTINHPIHIAAVKVNGEKLTFDNDDAHSCMDANVIALEKLSLSHKKNSFTVSFGVPDFSAPQLLRYQYFLEGYDEDWHVATTTPDASYTNLSPGSYKLHMKVFYENNEQQSVEKVIAVRVLQPWYNSFFAWIIYLIIFGFVAYSIHKVYRERLHQKRLLARVRQTEQLKEAKLRMFTSIAHELRSPLTMIVSPLSQLIASTEDKGLLSMYNGMKINCDRLINIVKQITDIRKIDNGQFHLHFSEVDFERYSDYVFQSFSTYAKAKNINYTIEHLNPGTFIWLDKLHFEKILTNLLSNAFKYTPEKGRIHVRTRCKLRNKQDFFEIRVYNSGSHINAEDLPHIFERFYQANNVKNEYNGSGIGLNLVSELVLLHHGQIVANNVNPDGVELIMTFPLHNFHLSEQEMLPRPIEKDEDEKKPEDLFADIDIESSKEEQETIEKRKKTVLVVDDDANLCQYVKSQLVNTYNIIMANSGNQAWKEVLKARPDAIVTDIRMPDGNGIELCQKVKGNPDTDSIALIMLTSENSDMAEIHSLNLQVDHFIRKPFNVLKLKSALAQCLKVRDVMMGKARRTEVDYDYSEQKIESADEKLFARINEAIKKNLDDSTFGVNELATEVGISRVHLNRKMKERYSVSPNNFIRSYRLKQAAYLLINNKVNVSEVAYKVGFSSHSHFSNTFREHFGMTPKDFIAYYTEHDDDDALKRLLE